MAKLTASGLNSLYASFLLHPSEEAEHFWSALRSWVVRCSYSVPAARKDDLIQDIMISIMDSMPNFQPGKDFTKWCNGIIRHKRADSYRNLYDSCEVPVSQLGIWDQEGNYVEYVTSEDIVAYDPSELLSDTARRLQASAKLDSIRQSLSAPADLELFDLMRRGSTLHQAAITLGHPYHTVQKRFQRFKHKSAKNLSATSTFSERNNEESSRAA